MFKKLLVLVSLFSVLTSVACSQSAPAAIQAPTPKVTQAPAPASTVAPSTTSTAAPAPKATTSTSAAASAAPANVIKLKFATVHKQGMVEYDWQSAGMKYIETASGGRIKVEMYGGDTLVAQTSMLQGIQSGLTDIGEIYMGSVVSAFPIGSVGQVPFLFDDLDHAWRVDQIPAVRDWWNEVLAPYNQIVSIGAPAGFYQILGTKRVKVPAEMKGLKIRAAGAMPIELAKRCGAAPINMAAGEIYESYMRGLLDGAFLVSTTLVGRNMWEVAHYLTEANVYYCEDLRGVNKKVYDSLPADLQKIVMDGMDQISVSYYNGTTQNEAVGGSAYKLYREKYEFYKVTPDEFNAWKQIAVPVGSAYRDSLKDPDKPRYDKYLALVEQGRKK